MWLFLIPVVVLCVGLWMAKKCEAEPEIVGIILTVCAGVTLLGLAISIPIERASDRDYLVRLKAFSETVRRSRASGKFSEIERAAILKDIADWNNWLASEKYWNQGTFDWWHLDEVMTLEPIE